MLNHDRVPSTRCFLYRGAPGRRSNYAGKRDRGHSAGRRTRGPAQTSAPSDSSPPRCYGDSSRASKVYSPSRCCCQGPIRSSVLITTHQVCLGEIETRGHSVCDTGPTPGPTSRDLRGRVAAPPRERRWARLPACVDDVSVTHVLVWGRVLSGPRAHYRVCRDGAS